ncbi:MAG: glycosyltransferase [Xanthobacteraceae bacterium]
MTVKLLVVAEGYPWGDNLAGVFHRDQLRQMVEAGLDVTLVGATPWVPPFLDRINSRWSVYRAPPRRQSDNGLSILRPRYPTLPRENEFLAPDFWQYLAVRALRLPRPDVIQGFYAIPPGAVARRLARHWQVPYLVGMLGDDVNLTPHHSARNMRMFRSVVRDATYAFANGPTLAVEVKRLTGVDVDSLSIGVSPSRFQNLPDKQDARSRLGLPQDRFLALYVGALVPAKGVAELGAALDRLTDRSVLGVAVGDGPLRGALERRDNAICLGVRPSEDVAVAMVAADLLVHPSHSEGLPTVLVEAAFARLPIVTTDARGCIDLARDGRAIVVPTGDAEALASAIAAVVADPQSDAVRQRVEAMLEHVRQHYTLENNTRLLIERYRALASGAPSRANR